MLNVTLRNTTHSALLRNVRGYFFSSTARWLKKLVFCSAHKEVRPATPHPNTHPPNSTREKLRYYLKMFTPNYWVFQIITHHNLTTTIYVMWVTEGSITRRAAHRCTSLYHWQMSVGDFLWNFTFVHHDVRQTRLNLPKRMAKSDTLFTTQWAQFCSS